MKFLVPFLVLLSLGTLLPAVSCNPYDDVESVTFPRLRTRSGANFPDVQQLSPVHRHLLQDSQGGVKVCNKGSPMNRTSFWRRSEMGFLFLLDFPESCGELIKTELIECTGDINVKKGCCSKECLDVFRKISPQCWKDLAMETCSKKAIDDVMRMDGLRRRCFPELGPFSCKECDLESKKKPDRKLQQQLVNLAVVRVPKACDKFQAVDLVACENSFNVVPGCCNEACHKLLLSLSDECWTSFNANACDSKTTNKLVRLMNDLSEKCEPVHRPVTCKGNQFDTPLSTHSRSDEEKGRKKKKLAAWAIALIVIACFLVGSYCIGFALYGVLVGPSQ